MSENTVVPKVSNINVSEQDARDVAEGARQKEWKQPSFLRELFLGNFRLDLLTGVPEQPERPEFVEFFDKLKKFVIANVDSAKIDQTGEYPPEVIKGLADLGCFGMKIDKKYGGLGFSTYEYCRVMQWLGSIDGNVCVLISAHQSIGVPEPIKIAGSDYLKNKYLPLCASGEAISGFGLTEVAAGSDPARLTTSYKKLENGSFCINGTKLWTTNGTIAKVLVVMARNAETGKISAFIVETDTPGFKVEHRCRFMGLRSLENGVLSFTDVIVPKENLLSEEGSGLKIALKTLNAGRLALPAASAGISKRCLEITRKWCSERVQWGKRLVEHGSMANRISDLAVDTYVQECISDIVTRMASSDKYDIRLEAASAKVINTELAWHVLDETVQARGGRGFETETSLKNRGEEALPVERMFRDSRINRIIEGATNILQLYLAREFVDKHLQVAGDIINPKATTWDKVKAFARSGVFYSMWYPSQYIPKLNKQWFTNKYYRYIEKTSRKLARATFHAMLWFGASLQHRQAYLFRLVDIGLNLFILSTALAKLKKEESSKTISHQQVIQMRTLLDLLYKKTKTQVDRLFSDMWTNQDTEKYKLAQSISKGDYAWIENF